jgi:hypothetical protein
MERLTSGALVLSAGAEAQDSPVGLFWGICKNMENGYDESLKKHPLNK